MTENTKALDLLRQANSLIQEAMSVLDSNHQPTAQPKVADEKPDEITLKGTIGRPEFKTVGAKNISLFTAGLKVDGDWFNIQAWRKVADWAGSTLSSGSDVIAHGEWTTLSWVDKSGANQTRTVFNVRAFDLS